MSYDEKTAERVRRILSGRQDVAEINMMGGISFMVGGGTCCRVSKRGFLIRVVPDTRDKILAMPHVKPTELAGRRMSAFAGIAPEGYRTDKELAAWVQRGIDVVLTLPPKVGAKKAAAKKTAAKKTRATKSRGSRR